MSGSAPPREPRDDHHGRLGRGFTWLGGATIVAKLVDFGTIVVMLGFLTKQQLGVASLVISIGMVVEALNGLGTGEALIQARTVSRGQLDTLFWYVTGASVLSGGAVLLASPAIASAYGDAGMAGYFVLIALKQPVVGAALIPMALMSRALQYERIALVNVGATLLAAGTRLGLGAAGAGTWALVAGYAASGLFTLAGAALAHPFRPRLRVRLAPVLPLARFGLHAAGAGIAEQMFKNIDYLLIGWFYGAAPLAIYRVAFDIAMEPAMAVGTLVNRTMLPVLARVAAVPRQLAQTLVWSLRRLVLLVAPLMAALVLAAHPLTALLHDHAGNSYAAAAGPLRLLALAALLRVTMLLLTTALIGTGRPAAAARLSAAALLLLGGGILAIGLTVSERYGLVAVSAVWLGIFPPLLGRCLHILRRSWSIGAAVPARTFAAPAAGVASLVLTAWLALALVDRDALILRLGIVMVATLATYAVLFWREIRAARLMKRTHALEIQDQGMSRT